jgi:acyl carrier protein
MIDRAAFLPLLADVFDIEADAISDEMALTTENWDSLAVLGVIALVDREFERTVSSDELKRCRSIADVLQVVDAAVAEA